MRTWQGGHDVEEVDGLGVGHGEDVDVDWRVSAGLFGPGTEYEVLGDG